MGDRRRRSATSLLTRWPRIEPAFAAALARAGCPEPRDRRHAAMSRCCARSSASRSRSRRPTRSGTSSRPRPAAPHDPASMAADQRRGPARRRPLPPEDALCPQPRRGGALRPARFRQPARRRRGSDRHLTAVKGIGRWTAEIYLLFAEGRPDIFPAGDLAVQIEIGVILGLEEQARPRKRSARWPKPGARIAARRRCSPGTIGGRARRRPVYGT